MAQNLVTQVARDGSTTPEPQGFSYRLRRLFCCVSSQEPVEQPVRSPRIPMSIPLDPGHNLLPPLEEHVQGKRCLVLDLDETLVHSSFKPIPNPDYIIPIDIEGQMHNVYVLKRPFVDKFLAAVSKDYELVMFTASLSKYADLVVDRLDVQSYIAHRLFREHCVFQAGSYIKDISRLGRPVKDIIIVDNSPNSYLFQPQNAIPILSWYDDPDDTGLLDLIPFLADLTSQEEIYTPLNRLQRDMTVQYM
eukprot:m.348882 g.348882  ORF g.348882 m.348882 type:complete len:248 (+) comp16148_c1_seq17:380-1123(+)